MRRLSEIWFILAEKISTIIFSFIFCWGAIPYLSNIEKKITHYLDHLSDKTGNDGYFVLESMVRDVSTIVKLILVFAPFIVAGILLRIINVNKK